MKHDPEPIDCDSARLQASAWIDGESPGATALVAHLERCGACRAYALELRALSARLAPLRAAGPEPDLWPAIAERARTAARPPLEIQRSRRIAAALIGCAVTAALLEAASRWTQAPPHERTAGRAAWAAALHPESGAERELSLAPEQRLLAWIDTAGGEQR